MDRRRVGVVLVAGCVIGLLWWASRPDAGEPGAPRGDGLSADAERVMRGRPGPLKPGPAASPSVDAPSPDASEGPPVALGGADPRTDEELAALAEALANDPNTQVTCDLGIDVRVGEAYLAIGGHSGFNGRRVQVVNGVAYLPLVYDLGDHGEQTFEERGGVFSLEGYGPVDIAWSDRPGEGHGRCTAPVRPKLGRASFTGTLTLAESGQPAAGGWVEGCGNMAIADEHGVVHMDIVPEPCTVVAMRQDGLLRTTSEPMAISPEPGRDVVVDIQIPESPRGGLGVQLSISADGQVQIDGLLGTGPAGDAGLLAGDVLVAVDGAPLAGLPLAEVVQAIGGPAGTEVSLTVDRSGQQLQFDIVREALTPG